MFRVQVYVYTSLSIYAAEFIICALEGVVGKKHQNGNPLSSCCPCVCRRWKGCVPLLNSDGENVPFRLGITAAHSAALGQF